jgi:hypothetical protein
MEIILSLLFFGLAGGIFIPLLVGLLFIFAGFFGSDDGGNRG